MLALSYQIIGLSPGVLALENTCCICKIFMAPLPSDMNFAQGGGGLIMMCKCVSMCVVVEPGKGQCTVTNKTGLFRDVLPDCIVRRRQDALRHFEEINVLGNKITQNSFFTHFSTN